MQTQEIMKIGEGLRARLRKLQGRFEAIRQFFNESEDDDLQEQAAYLDDNRGLERLASACRDEILLVRAALERIDTGSYGKCACCEKPIAENRLRARPETPTCRRCADVAA